MKIKTTDIDTTGTAGSSTFLRGDGQWEVPPGTATGTVTSVGVSVPTGFQVSGSPVTTSGSITISYDTGYQGYTSAEASKVAALGTMSSQDDDAVSITDGSAVLSSLTVNGKPEVNGAGELIKASTSTARGSGNAYVSFYDPTGFKGSIGYSEPTVDFLCIRQALNASMTFYTNNTERVRISGNGYFGVGTVPSTPLHFKTTGLAEIFRMETPNARGSGNLYCSFYDASGRRGHFGYDKSGSDTLSFYNQVGNLEFNVSGFSFNVFSGANTLMSLSTSEMRSHVPLRIPGSTPATSSATGTAGTVTWDSNYIYVCTATNTWKRAALSTW